MISFLMNILSLDTFNGGNEGKWQNIRFDLSKQRESNVLERSLRQRNQIDISFYLTTVACHFDDEYTVLSASAKSLYLELWFSFKSRNY